MSNEQWREIIRMLREHRTADLAYARAVEYANLAKELSGRVPASRERDALMSLTDYVIARDR